MHGIAPIPPKDTRAGVLFVCMGNICRSPTAETVFREHARRAGMLEQLRIESAGIGNWNVGGGRVMWIASGDDAEHACHVFNFTSKHTNLVQRRCEGDETVARIATVSRFHTDNAA